MSTQSGSSAPPAVPPAASVVKKTPSDFLRAITGRPCVVKLHSGVEYRGILTCMDGFINVALEQTEEWVNGQLKAQYGDAFIRGNNVFYIAAKRKPSLM